jgi:hypothetical protein
MDHAKTKASLPRDMVRGESGITILQRASYRAFLQSTALDSAKALKFNSVVAFLTEKGAKPGTPKGKLPEPEPQR